MAKHCSRLNSLHIENPECASSASPWVRPFLVDEDTAHVSLPSTHSKPTTRKAHDVDFRNLLEPLFERRQRHLTLAMVSFAAFAFILSFQAITRNVDSYIREIDPNTGPNFLTIALPGIHIAHLMFSPFMGFLGNKVGSIRALSVVFTLVFCSGLVLYATVTTLPEPRRWYVLAAHLLVGAASGTLALYSSYIASATTLVERTTAFSYFNFAGTTAMFLGPVLHLAFSPLETGLPIGFNLSFNFYTGPAWVAASLLAGTVVLFLPPLFSEYRIAKRESELLTQRAQTRKCKKCRALCNSPIRRLINPDKWALVVCITIFSSVHFCFVFIERLAPILTMQQLGFSESTTAKVIAIAFASAATYSGLVYFSLGPMARCFSERAILTLGIILLVIGPMSLNPLPGPLPPVKMLNTSFPENAFQASELRELQFNVSSVAESLHKMNNETSSYTEDGCPLYKQLWCAETPAIRREQLILGLILIVTGCTISVTMSTSILSKIIGPHPQGTWMGLLIASSCFARALFPLALEAIYPTYGPWATFGFMSALMIAVLFLLLVNYKRLVPFSYEEKIATHEDDESHPLPYALRPPKP